MFQSLQFAISQKEFTLASGKLRCPYVKCKCKVFKFGDDVMTHLHENGFMPNYYWWTSHSEEYPQFPRVVLQGSYYGNGEQREEFKPYE